MEKWTIDENGVPRDEKNNPLMFIQVPFEVKNGYGFMVYYTYKKRYYKYCIINGVKGRISRISFFDFMNVLKKGA